MSRRARTTPNCKKFGNKPIISSLRRLARDLKVPVTIGVPYQNSPSQQLKKEKYADPTRAG